MKQRVNLITLGVADSGGWDGVTLALNLASPAEVDATIEQAHSAGATIGASRP